MTVFNGGVVKDMSVLLQDSITVELVPSLKTMNIKKVDVDSNGNLEFSQPIPWSAKGSPTIHDLPFTVVYSSEWGL